MKIIATRTREAWNKGKLVGQKPPLRLRDIWAIRVRLQIAERTRDLAFFDLAIDSKRRACDLTKLRVRDVAHGEHVSSRAMVMQQKTQRPVQFEITEQHGLLSQPGYVRPSNAARTACSFADRIPLTICPLGNTVA